MKRLILLIIILLCIGTVKTYEPPYASIFLTDDDIRAFPGAQGFGRNSLSGRGQNVYFVTNTNDSGSGSLRQALTDANANQGGVIIFRVGGRITLTGNPLRMGDHITANSGGDSYGNIYLAGQTAPGDGIMIRADDVNYGAGFYIKGSDITMRHIRIYGGDDNLGNLDCIRIFQEESDAGEGHLIEDIMLDHLSLYHASDENLEIGAYGGGITRNISVTNTIMAEPMEDDYGTLLYASSSSGGSVYDISFWGNMWNDVNDRSPYASSCHTDYEVLNNIRYNCQESNNVTFTNEVDFVGNVFKNSNGQQPDSGTFTFRYINNAFECDGANPALGSVHQSDNLIINDNTGNGLENSDWQTYDSASRVTTNSLITPMASSEVTAYVTTNVGANLDRDANDVRVIDNFTNGTGSDATTETYLAYGSGTPYADSDGDGLGDDYETDNGGNVSPNDRPATFTIANGDVINQSGVTNYATEGYTHMDVFLADLAGDWDGFTASPPVGKVISGSNMKVNGNGARILD